jgi:hypothetical protein
MKVIIEEFEAIDWFVIIGWTALVVVIAINYIVNGLF